MRLANTKYRALGEYAVRNGTEQRVAAGLVDGVFRSMQEYDFVLMTSARDGTPVPPDADARLASSLTALDRRGVLLVLKHMT